MNSLAGMCNQRGAALALLMAAAALGAAAAASQADDNADDDSRTRRLEKMKQSAGAYSLYADGDARRRLTFVEKPVMRWNNPVNAALDGTVFLWTERGRPQAALQLYTFDDDHFHHEWQSLAERPLTAERGNDPIWTPEPGVRFAALDDFEAPATSAAARLRQMKALAARFSSTFVPVVGRQGQTPVELRLLPQPLFRYETGEDGAGVDGGAFDGALFAFVQGTDPQSLLVLEARAGGKTANWHYAFARLASGSIAARYRDHEIFSVPKYDFNSDRHQPFLLLRKQPAAAK